MLLKQNPSDPKRLHPEVASTSRRAFVHPNRFAPVSEVLDEDEFPPPSAALLPKRLAKSKTRLVSPGGCVGCDCAPPQPEQLCVEDFDCCACLTEGHPCLGPQGPEERAQAQAASEAAREFEEARVEELLANHLPAVEAYAAQERIEVGQALTELAGGNMPVAHNLAASLASPGHAAVLQPGEKGASVSGASLSLPPPGYTAYSKERAPDRAHWSPSRATQKASKWARRRAARAKPLSMLQRTGPTLAPVGRGTGTPTVRAIIDSGAEESVAPPGVFGTPVLPSSMSKKGQTYTAANGAPIRNLGRTTVPFLDQDARPSALRFQVAEVTQPLVSVAGLCDAGHAVIFHKGGGFIHNVTTKKKIRLARAGNTYVLDMVLPPAAAEEEEGDREDDAAAFRRQE